MADPADIDWDAAPPPVAWDVDPTPVKTFRVCRIIDTWFQTFPGLGRVQCFYDIQTDRRWAKPSEVPTCPR